MKRYFLVILAVLFLLVAIPVPKSADAFGECSDYGFMATYDYLSNSCKCNYGYVFEEDFLGNTTCVSGDSVCSDKYGYGSEYDSLSSSCECSYGYVFGKDSIGRTQCITETQSCQNQLGYNSRSTYGGQCECSYGYIIQGGQCVYGNTLCRSNHGLYSSYNDSDNSCECNNGYTLDDYGQCVEKQNNVYFTLKDVDTNEKRAIIKSEYDSAQYLITYGSGCYSSAMNRNNGRRVVVNLGTDFSLDTWDKIVLPDDDEICDIRSKERTYYDTFEEIAGEENSSDSNFYSVPHVPAQNVVSSIPKTPVVPKKEFVFIETPIDPPKQAVIKTQSNIRKCPSSTECPIIGSGEKSNAVAVNASFNDW